MANHSGTYETFFSRSGGLKLKLAVRSGISDGMSASMISIHCISREHTTVDLCHLGD
jgi:hypothetical protein